MIAPALDILSRLVAVPTVPRRANDEIVGLVLSLVAPLGARVHRVPSPLGDADGLVLSVGPDAPGGVLLSGHLDVVPVDGQSWTGDPFVLRRSEGRVYGRGTCDMKGFVACALALCTSYDRTKAQVPIHLALSADEETTCRSVDTLIETVRRALPPVRAVIVGEPSLLRPVDRHSASATHRVEVTGPAIHASLAHRGADAIALASRLIGWLREETDRNAQAPDRGSGDPGYALHTATRIEGGVAVNTVADRCAFDWDMRLAPGQSMDEVTERFDAHARALCAADPSFAVNRACVAYFPGLRPAPETPFRKRLLAATGSDRLHESLMGTEAGFFQSAGFDTVIWGPGDPAHAHIEDESIALPQLERCLSTLAGPTGLLAAQ